MRSATTGAIERVPERLYEPVADHALCLRTEHVEGERVVEHGVVRALERQHPDLGSVAVGDDDLVSLADSGQLFHRVDDVVLLNLGGGLLAPLQECVAA